MLTRITQNRIFKNLVGLYVIRIASMIIPLLTLPIISHRLGKDALGLILYSQYFGGLLSIILDFGFAYTATRLIARSSSSIELLKASTNVVQAAKLLLFVIYTLVVIISFYFTPIFRDNVWIVGAFIVQFAFLQTSPLWFFQGIEKVNIYATIELAGRLLLLCLTYFLVRGSLGIYTYAAISVGTAAFVWLLTTSRMYAMTGFTFAHINNTLAFIHESAPLFLMRLGSAMYMAYTPVYVGNALSASAVASYGGAERIFRAGAALLTPITDAIFPRLNTLSAQDNTTNYNNLLRISLIILLAVSILGVIVLYYSAPLAVRLLLGQGYEQAVDLIRILIWAIPAIAVGSYAGVQFLLSNQKDSLFTGAVIGGGAVNLFLLSILVPRMASTGAAIAVVITEWFVSLSCVVLSVLVAREKI